MPLTPAQEWAYWDTKSTDLRHGQLETVQTIAANWEKLFGAVIGIFGTVAFAGGLTTIDKLPSPLDLIIKIATLVAVAFTLCATYFAATAARGLSASEISELDADSLRERNEAAAKSAADALGRAKTTGLIAALIVLLGSAAILLSGEAGTKTDPPNVVAIVAGRAVCGKLATSQGQLSVDHVPLARATSSLTVVAKCPS
jgi:hypothetical protein